MQCGLCCWVGLVQCSFDHTVLLAAELQTAVLPAVDAVPLQCSRRSLHSQSELLGCLISALAADQTARKKAYMLTAGTVSTTIQF